MNANEQLAIAGDTMQTH